MRVTFARVTRSEWIKFWSLRSTVVTLGLAVVAFVGIGLIASVAVDLSSAGDGPASPTDISLSGSILVQLVLGTLGVLFMAGEYSTGMIRSTLTAVPRRLPVLWAKIGVFVAVSFVALLASAFVTFLIGQALIGANGASLSDPGVVRALFGTTGYLVGAGVMGLALGALLRSTPGAITTFFGITFLLFTVVELALPESWRDDVGRYIPSSAGSAMGAVVQAPDTLSPVAGAGVFLAYLVALVGAGAWRLKHHDA
ncbi:ABC transporter permease subunit [Cryptosporangium sp. NPDC048952]|uniref:ABC transporter permease subunit n=1 Tax=Cryptosporangium sp. NPDC048952 TaxID=3363961 RepID=UPI00371E120F